MRCTFIMILLMIGAWISPLLAQNGENCEDAILIEDIEGYCSAVGEFSIVGQPFSGMDQPGCFPQTSGQEDIWFRFVPRFENVSITVTGSSGLTPENTLRNPQMALYQGKCGELELEGCISDNQNQNFVELVVGDLKLGEPYYIRVGTRNVNGQGKFQLCVDNFQFEPDYSSDCIDATVLCDKTPITVKFVSGVGKYPDEARSTCLDTDPRTGRKDGMSEYSSVWFKWIAKDSGALTFTLDPLNPLDDLDFAVFELPGGLQDCDRKKLVRCMASGENVGAPLDDWIACTGATGLREGETHTSEERGCQPGNTNFLAPLEMEKGKAYALMVNNYSQSGHGFRLSWGGEGEFAGPAARMIFPDDKPLYCAGEEITFYAEDISISGKITDYEWIYADDKNTRKLSGPGAHKISFSTGGVKPIVLDLESDIGCVTSLDTAIEIQDPIVVEPLIDSISCHSYDDGRIELQVSSPTQVTDLFWMDGPTGAIREQLSPGEYTAVIRNETGCEEIVSFDLEEPPPINIESTSTNANCGGGSNGTITLHADGQFSPFQYDFSDGRGYTDDPVKEGLTAGVYPVRVMDGHDCEQDTFAFVNERDFMLSKIEEKEPTCYGESDGMIEIEIDGGSPPYEIDFDTTGNFSEETRFEDLAAGDYVIAIRDDDFCLGFQLTNLDQPDSLSYEIDTTGIDCFGESSGRIELSVAGGVPDYRIEWNTGRTGTVVSDLPAGDYQALIVDQNGCEKPAFVQLRQPPELILELAEKKDLLCFGDSDGFIELEASGGIGQWEFALDNGQYSFASRFNQLPAGRYTAVVKDENSCETALEIELFQPEEIIVKAALSGGEGTIRLGEDILLTGSHTPADRLLTWEWVPADFVDCADCLTTSAIPVRNTGFVLRGTDADGCWGEDELEVRVIPIRTVGIPNALVGGKDGPNGHVTLYAGRHVSRILEMNVFDRWGNLLYSRNTFEPNDYRLGWDGTAGGQTLIPGLYVYTIEVLYLDGITKTFSGEIQLLN